LANIQEHCKRRGICQKAYFTAAQKLVRDIYEGKNQTEVHHLQSMESLVARSLKFNRDEIEEWCDSRDWARANFAVKVDASKAILMLKNNLPALSNSDFGFPENLRRRAAEIVNKVADINADPVADFLFVKLSQEQQGAGLDL